MKTTNLAFVAWERANPKNNMVSCGEIYMTGLFALPEGAVVAQSAERCRLFGRRRPTSRRSIDFVT